MTKTVIGILGAGKLGIVLTQLLLKAGYTVNIAGSGNPEKIALTIKVITPGAHAQTASDVIAGSDIIILALPLSKYKNLPAQEFAGKLVIDAMNYWWEVDGDMPDLTAAPSSSEMVQAYLNGARVTKALSHMGYHNLLDDARPVDNPKRKAIAVASNYTNDASLVSKIIDAIGFDPVVIGDISFGKYLEPGNPLFGASVTVDTIKEQLKTY